MEILQSFLQIAQAVGGVSHFLVCLQITDSPPPPYPKRWSISRMNDLLWLRFHPH